MLEVFDCIMAEYTANDWQCLDRPCAVAYKMFDHRVVLCVEQLLRTYGRIENVEQLRVIFGYLDANLEVKELGR